MITNTSTKNNKNWVAGIFAAIGASLCCITPLLALLGGASGLATSFSWIEPYRPYFIAATVMIFGYAWYQKLKPQKDIDCSCETNSSPSFWQTKKFLGIITIIASLLIVLPYYAKVFYPKPQQAKVLVVNDNNIKTVSYGISGMDCEGCTAHINSELASINGVIEANTSYKNANSIVKFDNSKISADSIASAVANIGYKVTTITNNK